MSANTEIEPRSYQLELVDYITRRNGIIFLPTGSGKTYIAILALKRFSQYLQEPIENGGKRAIFMCNTVELARQQAACIKKLTNLKVGFYVGERDIDNWHRGKWDDEIRENQVLVGTAQVFLDILLQNYIKLSDLSVVIIDECHHGTGNHPMHEFMRLFSLADQKTLPRVIGLTGVLIKGNEKPETVQKRLTELEITYRGNIITVSDIEEMKNVMLYSTKPYEIFYRYGSVHNKSDMEILIKSKIDRYLSDIDKLVLGTTLPKMSKGLKIVRDPSKKSFVKNTFKDFIYQMEDFGLYTASIAIVSILIEFELKRKQAETIALRNMYRSAVVLCENLRHLMIAAFRAYDVDDENAADEATNSIDIIKYFSSPKLFELLDYLKTTFSNKKPEEISCLIFVERRHTAKCIYGVIQKFIDGTPELKNVLSPQFMVGRNNTMSQDFEGILARKWDKTAIEQFRDNSCNMIICSNVLEEGIDVQACNYVIVLDQIKTFNSYVQTKGRARAKNSTYVMFVPKLDEGKLARQCQLYQQIYETIKNYLQKRLLQRNDPNINEIEDHFTSDLKPFINESGATLLPSSALSLLHRYCQTLPSDKFGIVLAWLSLLTAEEKMEKFPFYINKEIVSLQLPLTSKLRQIIYSDPMSSNRDAKISAAFKTCLKLYEIGELNEKFLPKSIRDHVATMADVHFEHWKKFNDDVTKKSTEEVVRIFANRCPTEFYDTLPRIGETCYAYRLIFTPNFEEINDYNEYVYNGLQTTTTTYALLLRKRLPRLAEMPLYTNQGKLGLKVTDEPIEIRIETEAQLKQLQMFHLMIFRDLLNIWHSYLVLDKRSKEYSYLVVPTNMDCNGIDWALVRQFQRISKCRPLTIEDRSKMEFRPEDYMGKVITQWYANFEYKRFVVTQVHTNMTPACEMDIGGTTFAEFTKSKYGHCITDIVHGNQFLLEVRELTSRLNFFINAKGKTQAIKKFRSKVFLIPELCHNFKYPGDMWLKALFLPCILHRLKFMLHAEHLRLRVNKFLNLHNEPYNTSAYHPKPLIVDTSLRRNFDDEGNAVAQDNEFVEPKSVLDPLPSKDIQLSMAKLHLNDFKVPWQTYMEPVDLSRKIMTTYPVELSYYYKFTAGLLTNRKDMLNEVEEVWTKSQFDMPSSITYGMDNMSISPAKPLPAIESGAAVHKTGTISILTRSGDKENLTAAEQAEFLAALTTASASDVFDMERFEVLGDSFLKFSATLYLASKYPLWNEGVLTQVKSKMVSNRNLLYCLHDTDIPECIYKTVLNPKYSWLPPSSSLPYNVLEIWQKDPLLAKQIGVHNLHDLQLSESQIFETGLCDEIQLDKFIQSCKQNAKTSYQNYNFDNEISCFVHREPIRDKIIADTLEALLGVCVKNYGIHNSFRMLEFFGIVKSTPEQKLTHLLDLKLGSDSLRTNISAKEVDSFLTNYGKLEKNLGYTFRDRAYLLQALTHPSFPTNRITGCYQELEFIGDAILDFLISAYIFEQHTSMTPGALTDLRSALVNNTTLACLCVRHRFHLFILAENAVLAESIKNFAEFQESQHYQVTDQVRILMEESDTSTPWITKNTNTTTAEQQQHFYNISENVDVPKALGDILEALIAAVYMDSRDLQQTWQVIYGLFKPELSSFPHKIPINAVRQLNEHKYAKPKFGEPVLENNTIMVSCKFMCLEKTITVHGFGQNSKQAKLSAAKHALQTLAKHETK